ncbi:MAG: FAD-dependent oxidoreductase [Bacteroidota bacterium]
MANKETVHIIGAGVIGLCTAILLGESGYQVKVLSSRFSPNTTSDKAAAIWFPFLAEPRDKVQHWSLRAFDWYRAHARMPETGVRMVPLISLEPEHVSELPWWLAALPGEKPTGFLSEKYLPEGYKKGIQVDVPLIETHHYMPFLMQSLELAHVKWETQTVSDLEALCRESYCVVNCTGLGARALVDDPELYPIRGQLLKVTMDHPPKVIYTDDEAQNALAYIIPRSDGIILGGTAEQHQEIEAVDQTSLDHIHQRCAQILPEIKTAKVVDHYVGLRPARSEIRLEFDPNIPNLIHNYGHGGSGYTVSWGCAEAVNSLIRTLE